MTIQYLILNKNFVKSGKKGGQASHAEGVFNGLVQNGIKVKIFGPKSLKKYIPELNHVDNYTSTDPFGFKNAKSLIKASLIAKPDYLIIRKCITGIVLYIITRGFKSISNQNLPPIIWEVNNFSNVKEKSILHLAFNAIIFKINLFVLRKSKLIYVVTTALRDKLINNNIDPNKIIYIPNGSPDFRDRNIQLSKSQCLQFCFFGVLKPYNNFERIISALKRINEKLPHLIFELTIVGYGDLEDYIKKRSKELSWLNYRGPKTLEELAEGKIIHQKCVGLIPMEDENSAFRSPIKLFEYLSLGIPVLISEKVVIEESIDCDVFETYTTNESNLEAKMLGFFNNEYDWKKTKEICLRVAKENTWESRMQQLINQLKN